jgi:hypothetical protein
MSLLSRQVNATIDLPTYRPFKKICRASIMKRLEFIVFSRSKEQRYGLTIDRYQSHKTLSLIFKNQYTSSRAPLVRPSGGP